MGPGNEKSPPRGGIADPPIFSPNKDNYSWRKDIANWVDLVKVGAEEGEDKLYKTVFKPLGQKIIVDHAQQIGKINYKQEDQVAAVQQIVDFIAIDPPIVVVSRLTESFNKVSNCRRKKNESLTNFVSRFSVLASEHLMHADTSPNSKIGKVLAITLLTNANLGETTHQSAKIQLINAAKAREPVTTDPNVPTPKCTLYGLDCTDLKHVEDKLRIAVEGIEAALSSTGDEDNLERAREALQTLKTSLTSAKALQNGVVQKISYLAPEITASSSGINIKSKPLPIFLDDAIAVIRSIEQGGSSSNPISALDVEAIVERSLLAAKHKDKGTSSISSELERKIESLFAHARSESGKRHPRGSHFGVRDGRVPKGKCKDCGESGHFRGHLSCPRPSFYTLTLREKKDKNEEGSEGYRGSNATANDSKKRKVFFRKGSGSKRV